MQIWQELMHAKAPELKSGLFRFTKIRSREKEIISWQIEKWVFWEFCQKSQADMQVNSFLSIFCCSYHEQVYVSFFQSHRTIFYFFILWNLEIYVQQIWNIRSLPNYDNESCLNQSNLLTLQFRCSKNLVWLAIMC